MLRAIVSFVETCSFRLGSLCFLWEAHAAAGIHREERGGRRSAGRVFEWRRAGADGGSGAIDGGSHRRSCRLPDPRDVCPSSDGIDYHLDTNGAMASSVAATQKWFVAQTGGTRRLRFDTSNGELDISFFVWREPTRHRGLRCLRSRSNPVGKSNAAGFNHPEKIYAVYYGGGSATACGGGAWPPTLTGNVVALYLRGRPPGARPCSAMCSRHPGSFPGYWEFSLNPRILSHARCVRRMRAPPHQSRPCLDDPRDLMYAGDRPWRPSMLDVGNDDYFNHNTDCLDVAKSVFIDPVAADAVAPPGWKNHKTITLRRSSGRRRSAPLPVATRR